MVYIKKTKTNGWLDRWDDWPEGRRFAQTQIGWCSSLCVSLRLPSYMYKVQVCRYHTSPGTVGGGD